MDGAGGITTIQKAGEMLKSAPDWLLIGAVISLLLFWLWPPLASSLPDSIVPLVPPVLFVTATLTICKLAATALHFVFNRRRAGIERDREKLLNLYRPLAALFITRHLAENSTAEAARFQQRLENACTELRAYRRRWVGVKRAWRALFDRRGSSSTEMEFGGDFPLSQIVEMVKKQADHADEEIFYLMRRADRSRFEEPECVHLTDEEVALFKHIYTEHRRLSARAKQTT